MSKSWPLLVFASLKYCAESRLLKTHVTFFYESNCITQRMLTLRPVVYLHFTSSQKHFSSIILYISLGWQLVWRCTCHKNFMHCLLVSYFISFQFLNTLAAYTYIYVRQFPHPRPQLCICVYRPDRARPTIFIVASN
jgi:hypothetical protein